MANYPVLCACKAQAQFKIASVWSDGYLQEYKTYYLCCFDCIQTAFRLACDKRELCRLDVGETIEGPFIYERTEEGLRRRADLEQA